MKCLYVPCKDLIEAENISLDLLKKKLVICVNIFPRIRSLYLWKNKIEKSSEAILIAKTKNNLADKAADEIKHIHSYNTPEVLILSAEIKSKDIKDWVDEELG
ncbi:divalent-cation tolerance protein CutA [Candidatus Gottesmanbacteria bacterium]|nr:divalent-cation tolerance protein CutA [Candidatus Gottesmanbacteria bacterium]